MKLLAIRMSALGDVAMTLPVIYSVARQYPELEIYVLTRPFFAGLFINRPSNVSIIEADLNGEYHGVGGMRRLLKKLSTYDFDCVADLHNVLRSWIIDRFMRVKVKRVAMVDKYRSSRKELLEHRIDEQPPFIERYCNVFATLGYPVELTFKSLYDGVDTPQPPIDIRHPAVGIAPMARYANKTYPADRMKSVIKLLTDRGVNVYLFGAKGSEAEELGRWAEASPLITSVAGRYTLEEELSILAHLDVMVSMDSANQHMASLVATRVVTIWGSTTPACGFQPYGQDRADGLCLGCDCQPCTIAGSSGCNFDDLRCVTGLTPEAVANKIFEILDGND